MLTGRTLGPYRVNEKLGAGGMGEVYKAHDSRLDRVVALKVLTSEIATPERLHRFEQEARAASALNHPNILTIHDVGREADVAYFAMEWVEGHTLRELMSAGRLPLRRLLNIAQQIADGLAKAHAAGIVHRDLKPENVMLTADGFVKIVDFGIAKLDDSSVIGAGEAETRTIGTSAGLVLGTVGYMSPEQASGKRVDYRSDQFALGLLIYEMATAIRPFERATTAQSLAATIDAEPTPIDAVNREVPAHLAAVVARCLAKDPAERYESTRDLARDLKSISDTGARSTGVLPQATTRRPARTQVVAALALIAIAGGAAAWWGSRRTPPPAPEKPRPLIAVRPFRSLSADAAQAYFAAGVTEEIRGGLSQVSSLRLLSRNALEAPAATDATKIARELGVTQLVDGSVRVEGRRVRVTAELIDASTQQTIWSDQYDRDVADVLAVQSDVALQIVRALSASLSPAERQRLGQAPTGNAEAYRLYLEARAAPSFNRARNLAAIELLRKAVSLDPGFAMAHASIGFRQVLMGYYDSLSNIDQGIATAETALKLNPSLPFAYFVLGTGYAMKGEAAKARLAFLRALELDPNNGSAMANLSVLDSNFGRPGEGLVWARRMFALSGQKANDFYHLVVPLINLRADDVARRTLLEGERRYPDFPRLQVLLSALEFFDGATEAAVRRVARARQRSPEDEELKFMRADYAYLSASADLGAALDALSHGSDSNTNFLPLTVRLRRGYLLRQRGQGAGAAKVFAEAEKLARERMDRGDGVPSLRIEMAAIAALRPDHAAAITWLERAFDAGYRDYGIIERDPILLTIEPQAKVREILDKMRRDLELQRTQVQQGGLLDIDALLRPAK